MAKQSSCCHKKKLRRGLWSPEEDEKLMNHIAMYGHGCWSSVPKLAGLERCGKSCRLRWINYLRPDLKRGTFSQEEEDLIIQLHSMLGNKWSQIAAQLPGRTDNEVKNFWNSYIKKKLRERGIDPATHKPLVASSGEVDATGAAELIPSATPRLQAPLADAMLDGAVAKLQPLDWTAASSSVPPSMSSGYLQTVCNLGMDVLALQQEQQRCGSAITAAPPVVPSASCFSKLTSMADDAEQHCNNNNSAGANLPWQELGPNTVADAGHVDDSYDAGAALDELRWSEYFDDAFQTASSSQQGALQQGQCIYGGSKDDVQIDVHGLSNWC